jgi:hypothetical protein
LLTVLIDVDTLSQLQIDPALARRPNPDAYDVPEGMITSAEMHECERLDAVVSAKIQEMRDAYAPFHELTTRILARVNGEVA